MLRSNFATLLLLVLIFSAVGSTTSLAKENSAAETLFSLQWGLNNRGQVFQRATGDLTRDLLRGREGMDISWKRERFDISREVTVAVIDSGIDYAHPELKGRIWQDPGCEAEEAKKCAGWNFLENSRDVSDDTGHGTHVAGTIAANWDNLGVAGVAAPQIQVMPLKVLNKKLDGFVYKGQLITNVMAKALRFARTRGADVVNMSLGWPSFVQTPAFVREVEKTLEADIPIIVAAGNNRKNVPTYPCSMEGIICVGAIDHQGKMTSFSNFGGRVDLFAPGENIVSLFPRDMESRRLRIQGHELKKGTSQAAPFVSGIAATLKLLYPEMTLGQMRARLLSTGKTGEAFCPWGKTKFGCVSMERATNEKRDYFVEPLFKDLLSVEFDQTGSFEFDLPVKNWLKPIEDLAVSVSLVQPRGEVARLEKQDYQLSLGAKQKKRIEVSGEVTNFHHDSHVYLEVKLHSKKAKITRRYRTMLAFSRDLNRHPKFRLRPIQTGEQNAPLKELLVFRGKRKLSRLSRVEDRQNFTPGRDFYFAKPGRDKKMDVFLYHLGGPREGVDKLELPRVRKILSVLEGKFYPGQKESGYMVYSLKDGENLLLSFFDGQGDPLYSRNTHWTFPLSTFKGLPVQAGKHSFQWVRYHSEELPKLLGEGVSEVMVPAFQRQWFVPEKDNTRDLLERIPRKKRSHYYYLRPTQAEKKNRAVLQLRALDGHQLRERLREQLDLVYGEGIVAMPGLEQSPKELSRGEVTVPLAIGESSQQKVWGLRVKRISFSAEPPAFDIELMKWGQNHLLLANNLPVYIRRLKDGKISSRALFAALRDQQRLRLGVLQNRTGKGGISTDVEVETSSWTDQIFAPLAFFTKEKGEVLGFIEARHHMYATFRGDGGQRELKKLPLNRESSFPGVEFSENFRPLRLKNSLARGDQWLPSLYVDSTLIFGDRVYTMSLIDGEFWRPAAYSLKVPKNCTPLGPMASPQWERRGEAEKSWMSFLCRGPRGKTQWGLFPL